MGKTTLELVIIVAFTCLAATIDLGVVEGGKRRIHVSDDLDDVVDDEEDDSWKEWGKKKASSRNDLPPDFSGMNVAEIQETMAKMSVGPVFGFAKLRLGVPRTREMVGEIAKKWTKLSRTGGVEARFTGVDLSTVMFNMELGRDREELKEFILNQEEAYEVKIGDQIFRRPGDPPMEEVIEEIQRKRGESAKEEL